MSFYFPYWNDTTYFPRKDDTPYTPANLNAADNEFVKHIPRKSGLKDFANLIGGRVGVTPTNPKVIQQALNQAYQAVYGAPPTPPSSGPFEVAPASSAQVAVNRPIAGEIRDTE